MSKPEKLTLTLMAIVLTPMLALAQDRVGDFSRSPERLPPQHELSR